MSLAVSPNITKKPTQTMGATTHAFNLPMEITTLKIAFPLQLSYIFKQYHLHFLSPWLIDLNLPLPLSLFKQFLRFFLDILTESNFLCPGIQSYRKCQPAVAASSSPTF